MENNIDISIYIFREGEHYVAYCPSFDVSSTGTDYLDAVKNFYECLQLHLDCCASAGTLADDLRAHGWRVGDDGKLVPPSFSSLSLKPEMSALLAGSQNYERIVTPMHIQATA